MKYLNKAAVILVCLVIANMANAQEIMKVGFWQTGGIHLTRGEDGKMKGLMVDYTENTLAPAMGVKIEWVGPAPIRRLLALMKSGKIDCLPTIMKSGEREEVALFSTAPSWYSKTPLVVKKDSPLKKVSYIKDLYNLKIGCGLDVPKPNFMSDSNVKFDPIAGEKWQELNLKKLLNGRVDAVYFPSISNYENNGKIKLVEEKQDKLRIIILPQHILGDNVGIFYHVFSKKADKGFLEKYNELIGKTVLPYTEWYAKNKEKSHFY